MRATAWIPSLGYCMRMRGGTLVLALDDGATLSLDRAGQTVAMTDADGSTERRKVLEAARDPVMRRRLELVPRFVKLLRSARVQPAART